MILNNNNLDIFVCSHKQYESPVHNEVYKTLSLGNNKELYGDNVIRDDTLDNVVDINLFYSELSGYYWIYKNYDIKDYIGFCHYRRYFDFFDNIPDIDKEDCDIILPTPLKFNMSVYNQYKICHNIEDLLFVINIMANKYKVPINIIFEVMEQTQMCCCNMFITSKEIFKEYCEMFFDICNEYLKYYNIKNIEDIYKLVENNKSKYLKDGYPGNDIKYQSRIGGFLSVRIFNIFIKWKNLNVKYVDVVLTEEKYKEKLSNDFI